MTRFARAKGSKASNERVAEEATSWQEMKKQMELKNEEKEVNKKRKESESVRQKNYDNFVETVENEKANSTVWADFPEVVKKTGATKQKHAKAIEEQDESNPPQEIKIKKNKTIKRELNGENTLVNENNSDEKDAVVASSKKRKNLKNEQSNEEVVSPKKIKKSIKIENTETVENGNQLDDEAPEEISAKIMKASKQEKTKKKKVKQPKQTLVIPKVENGDSKTKISKKIIWSHLSEEDIKKIMDKKRERRHKRSAKLKELKRQKVLDNPEAPKPAEVKNTKLTRKDKIEKAVEYKRRKPEPTNTVIVNGETVELVMFSGYPVRVDDAKRLTDLKKKMISRGIPRSEVERTLKLERRKCEKALVRLKKNVCFNCRKSGHNLSDCPELENSLTISSGICFKCGSTEHTHFECKVVKNETDFKFASCFICKEQGHIARQCPENPRGLYPKGGGCKLCGDVTHFKKDCPTLQEDQQDQNLVSLGVLDDNADIEGLGEGNAAPVTAEIKKKVKKIKF